jgi:hypothetical protein
VKSRTDPNPSGRTAYGIDPTTYQGRLPILVAYSTHSAMKRLVSPS